MKRGGTLDPPIQLTASRTAISLHFICLNYYFIIAGHWLSIPFPPLPLGDTPAAGGHPQG